MTKSIRTNLFVHKLLFYGQQRKEERKKQRMMSSGYKKSLPCCDVSRWSFHISHSLRVVLTLKILYFFASLVIKILASLCGFQTWIDFHEKTPQNSLPRIQILLTSMKLDDFRFVVRCQNRLSFVSQSNQHQRKKNKTAFAINFNDELKTWEKNSGEN